MMLLLILNIVDCLLYFIFFINSGHCTLYHMCGDNIDKVVKSRYIRFGQDKQQSIHYFNSYAVADRVDFTSLSDRIIPTLQTDPKQIALSLLPTPEDDRVLKHNICILMSRILFKHVDFFSLWFDGVIDWHIKHEFWEEMSKKSQIVSIYIVYV